MLMKHKIEPSFWVCIHIAGDMPTIREAVRHYTATNPMCVAVKPQSFIYHLGAQEGAEIRAIQYPRFPEHPRVIRRRMEAMAHMLLVALNQRSCTIEDPEITEYIELED